MEQAIVFILQRIGQFVTALNFPIFENGITFLQFILAVPISILIIKVMTFVVTQYANKQDFSLFDYVNDRRDIIDTENSYDFDNSHNKFFRSSTIIKTNRAKRTKSSDTRVINVDTGKVVRVYGYSRNGMKK